MKIGILQTEWVKAQGMRGAVLAMKIFLPYFLYTLARKMFYRLLSASQLKQEQNREEQNEEEQNREEQKEEEQGEGEQKKLFLSHQEPVPSVYENRRIVSASTLNIFLPHLQNLRDSFPDHERLFFGWGNFRASGSLSSTIFPDLIERRGIYISMENPILGRAFFEDTTTRDKGYFRIALCNTASLNRGDFSLPVDCSDARLRSILHTTKTTLKPYRKTGEHILYALQVPHDISLAGLDVFSAAQHDLVALRFCTSRPIVLTANPATMHIRRDETHVGYLCLKELCKDLGIPFHERFEEGKDSSQYLKNCWCVVCHSSGFAVDAVLAGVPAITLHRGNFVYPICSHELSEIENPRMPERMPWLSRLAYCQWTLEEIKSGEVWRHFQPSIERLLENK